MTKDTSTAHGRHGITITRLGNELPQVEFIGSVTTLQLQELLFTALVSAIGNTLAQNVVSLLQSEKANPHERQAQ